MLTWMSAWECGTGPHRHKLVNGSTTRNFSLSLSNTGRLCGSHNLLSAYKRRACMAHRRSKCMSSNSMNKQMAMSSAVTILAEKSDPRRPALFTPFSVRAEYCPDVERMFFQLPSYE